MGKIEKLIAVSAKATIGEKYEVIENGVKIGVATFLGKNKEEEFEFETDFDNTKDYDYMFDLDKESYELIKLRVEKNK